MAQEYYACETLNGGKPQKDACMPQRPGFRIKNRCATYGCVTISANFSLVVIRFECPAILFGE